MNRIMRPAGILLSALFVTACVGCASSQETTPTKSSKEASAKELIEGIESKPASTADTDTSLYNTSLWDLKTGESWVDGVVSELSGAYSMPLKDLLKKRYFVQYVCQKGVTLKISLDQEVAGTTETNVETVECDEKMTRKRVDVHSSGVTSANIDVDTAGEGKWSFMLGAE
ncbi:hypothetical protein G7068_10590 [Leucobacter viscericola]|uniref:Lipoprotein n=1 Tax=Leucobacter viscericola TaxID=2714935 RepID=A0A6G7XGU3_9MICO|nr:hypothetical protein [Leucobacter viscericola]QIK63591.1 hypothetical protein G7068_10590 [Leucobacter viscericola]